MDYTQAVKLAKEGKEEGYKFLYEETYKSKYYLALKYMKDENDAQDVIQDAYIKAFSKLDTLEKPENFASWFGVIVANTAKNALVKQNPILFTDIAVDSEDENFEYEIEDDNVDNQPEVSYTRKETQELVHELLDTLPEEQKLSILMFHIEGLSLKEIAKAMNCNENTVKSRLNYGRKNIKTKAEELKKKGYTLYNVAPLPLLVRLILAEAESQKASGAFAKPGSMMAEKILEVVMATKDSSAAAAIVSQTGIETAASGLVQQAAEQGGQTMLNKLLGKWIGTFAAKSVAVKTAAAITAAAVVATPAAVSYVNHQTEAKAVQEESVGGLEGTKNLDEFMNKDGSLKNATDVSDFTDEDLEKLNAEKDKTKKEAEQEYINNHPQNWENIEKQQQTSEPVENEPVENPPVENSPAPETNEQPEPEVVSPSVEDQNDDSNESNSDDESSDENDKKYPATPGSVGPNGEVIGDISTMPGYSDSDVDISDWTQEDLDALNAAKKEAEQEYIDNHPQNWENIMDEQNESIESPSEDSSTNTSAEETPVVEETPSETSEESDVVVVQPTPSSSDSSSDSNDGDLLGSDGNTHAALEEAFKQAQEILNESSGDEETE